MIDRAGAELAVGLTTPDGEPAERIAPGAAPGPMPAAAPHGDTDAPSSDGAPTGGS